MVGGEHPTFNIQHSTVTLNIPHSKKGVLLESKRTRFGRQKESFFECGMLNVECGIHN